MKRFSHFVWLVCLACPLCLGIAPVVVAAEVRHELTLDSSISYAVLRGYAASDLKARYIAARKNAESARRRLWTSVGVTVNAPSFQESLVQQFNPLTGRYEYYQLKSTSLQGTSASTNLSSSPGGTCASVNSCFHAIRRAAWPGQRSNGGTTSATLRSNSHSLS